VPERSPPPSFEFSFNTSFWFSTITLSTFYDSLVRVSRRDEETGTFQEPAALVVEVAIDAGHPRTIVVRQRPPQRSPQSSDVRLAFSSRSESSLGHRVADASPRPPPAPFLLSPSVLLGERPGQDLASLVPIPFCSLYAISGSFDSSFDVLFNFRSRYFSSIGLCVIFRFSRNLPAALR